MTRSGGARARWKRLGIAGLMACGVLFSAPAVRAQETPLVAGLSNDLVAITTGFAGTDVLLFGATEGEGDVVVIVRGPDRPVVMHRKSRVLGVWINTAKMTFARAPASTPRPVPGRSPRSPRRPCCPGTRWGSTTCAWNCCAPRPRPT